jgi:hypothetical protein
VGRPVLVGDFGGRPLAPPETLRAHYHYALWRGADKGTIEIAPPVPRHPLTPPETLRAHHHSALWRGAHKGTIEIAPPVLRQTA